MKVFIQGMRRSGTTLLYDVFCADGRFDAYYEPLAAAKRSAVGGGSRMREEDFFAKIREARAAYGRVSGLSDLSLLNCGAPRDPALETGREMDERVVGYLRFLLEQGEHSVLKFVRAYRKVAVLRELSGEAFLLHIVRDPRAVATSFLFGKGRIHAAAYGTADDFFECRGGAGKGEAGGPRNLQAMAVADELIRQGELAVGREAPVYEKLMALWGYHFRETDRDGRACFGERYRLVRYEDLLRQPGETLRGIYGVLGEEENGAARAWLEANLADRPQVYAEGDLRWGETLRRLGLQAEMEAAGYEPAPNLTRISC